MGPKNAAALPEIPGSAARFAGRLRGRRLLPPRLAEIDLAGVGQRAGGGTGGGADCRTGDGSTDGGADDGTARGADQSARGGAVILAGAAGGKQGKAGDQHQGRGFHKNSLG